MILNNDKTGSSVLLSGIKIDLRLNYKKNDTISNPIKTRENLIEYHSDLNNIK